MNISIYVQPLINKQKTGIGFCAAGTVGSLIEKYRESFYTLEYFDYKNSKEHADKLRSFGRENCITAQCGWFPYLLYRLLWNFIPIPYHIFFKSKPDITHFFDFYVPPGVRGKRVATVHDMSYKVYPETVRLKTKLMLNLSLKRSCKRAHKIITVSEFSKQEIIRYMNINADKIVVAPNGLAHDIFKPQTDIQKTEAVKQRYNIQGEYFLYLGTLEPRKNIERLVEAYSALKKETSNVPLLVMAGRKGWLYDSIFKKVKELKLEQSIIFTGYAEDEDTPLLLSGATAFVFPSLYEGFGLPPLEAMACGTPVLTSNCSSLPEVVGDAAILVDPYSVAEITQGMKNLMTDENLRTELSQKGMERAKLFTWDNTADIIYNVYKELLGQK